jgi:hypothetical protein
MCLTSMDHVTSMLTTTTTTDHASTCTFPLQACNRIPQRWMLARAAGLPLVSAFTGLSLTFALFSSQIPQQPCRSASESIAAAYCSAQQPMSVPKIQLADGRYLSTSHTRKEMRITSLSGHWQACHLHPQEHDVDISLHMQNDLQGNSSSWPWRVQGTPRRDILSSLKCSQG